MPARSRRNSRTCSARASSRRTAELERIKAHFADPAFEAGAPDDARPRRTPISRCGWTATAIAHKQPGYSIATISLKPVGGIPGDATADQIRLMADLAKQYTFDELRVTHAQNIVLPHVRKADLYTLWQQLDAAGLGTPNLDLIGDIIACPGLDYCSLANARSIPVAQKMSERFAAQRGRDRRAQAQDLGLHQRLRPPPRRPHRHPRRRRKGLENYQLLLGGCEGEDTSLGQITGPGFDEDGIVEAVEKATDVYLAQRSKAGALPRHLPPHRHGPVQGGDLRQSWPSAQFRFRDDEPVGDPAVTVDAFCDQTNAAAVRLEAGRRCPRPACRT